MTETPPNAFPGLDRTLHEKARLGILTALVGRPKGLSFTDLMTLCALTNGNLSRHLSVLEEGGIVRIAKGYEGNRPQTVVQMTASGRKQFLDYLGELERVLRTAMDAAEATEPQRPPGRLSRA